MKRILLFAACSVLLALVALPLAACAKAPAPAPAPSPAPAPKPAAPAPAPKPTAAPAPKPVAPASPAPKPAAPAAVQLPWEKWPLTQVPAAWGWPEFFLTNGATAFYADAVAVAELVKKYSPVKTQVVQIGTGVKGVTAVLKGDASFNIVDASVANAAFLGVRDFTGTKPGGVLGLATPSRGIQDGIYIRTGSGIKTPADLKGKKIAYAESIPLFRITTEAVLKGYGMTWDDVKKVSYTASNQLPDLMRQNLVDMYIYTVAPNTAMTTEMTTTGAAYLLGIDADKIDAVVAATGNLYPKSVLPANSYKGQDKELITLSHLNLMHVKSDLPESLVYTVTRVLWEHNTELQAMGSSVSKDFLDVKDATKPAYMMAAFHAGAVRYYKEKGVWGAEQDKIQQSLQAQLKEKLDAFGKK